MFLLCLLLAAQLLYVFDFALIFFLLCHPEEEFVELCEFLKDRSFPGVLLAVLGHLDDGVDGPHDEICVVSISRKLYPALTFDLAILGSQCEVIADLDIITVNEVFLLIVDAVTSLMMFRMRRVPPEGVAMGYKSAKLQRVWARVLSSYAISRGHSPSLTLFLVWGAF
jgi:hypothetical protein